MRCFLFRPDERRRVLLLRWRCCNRGFRLSASDADKPAVHYFFGSYYKHIVVINLSFVAAVYYFNGVNGVFVCGNRNFCRSYFFRFSVYCLRIGKRCSVNRNLEIIAFVFDPRNRRAFAVCKRKVYFDGEQSLGLSRT